MADRVALVTGITGQDGRYAAELLTAKGYRVVGTTRSAGSQPVGAIPPGVELAQWNLIDPTALGDLLVTLRPTEFYNFGARSSGSGMFDDPVGIAQINGVAVARMLEVVRSVDPAIRFCQASSSEMFGAPAASPQREDTPFLPRSPYGAAKLYAHWMIDIDRKRYGSFACSAILFNHESPLRRTTFVTRKISRSAAAIKLGLESRVSLGNLESRRDWGFAPEYVRAMWLMLQSDRPADYVIATGRTHSVRELCELAFSHVGLDYRDYVAADPSAYRPLETSRLVGDPAKAARELGWAAETRVPELIRMMVDADLAELGKLSKVSNPSRPAS